MKLTDINEWVCGKCNCEPCRCDSVVEKWSSKYKKSIDCSNPKGFSQKAHCAGRKKKKSESVSLQELKQTFPNRYSSTSTSDSGVTTTKFVGGGKSVSSDAGTTVFNPDGTKASYTTPAMKGFSQTVNFKGGPRIDNVKNTYKTNGITRTTNAIGQPTSTTVNYGDAKVSVDNKGFKSASYSMTDNPKDRIRVSRNLTPKQNMASLNKLKQFNSIQELKIVKPDSVDTKGLKRSQMPQIHKDDYNEFIDYLKDNGAEFTKQTMPAKQLKATQGEFSDKGVMKQIGKQMAGEPRKPVIASQDNFIIDGHHRWLVAWNIGDTVDVFKVNIDADKLLELVKKFPKTTYKDIYTEELYDFDKDEPMKSTVAVPGYGTMSIDGLMKNLVQSVTELLAKMKQGTDGMRFADYELNKNGVVTAKLSALIKALDDLQAIRKQGGARSRNIQKEQDAEQEQQELPINTDAIMGRIQEFESKQFVTPQDADLMRRGVQSLESARQTLNPKAILQLLTMVTS